MISKRAALAVFAASLATQFWTDASAWAKQDVIVHDFAGGSDGAVPLSGLVSDGAGNFFGTTVWGGGVGGCQGQGCGTVFKLASDGTLTVLYAFDLYNGAYPNSLFRDASGDLYGTTEAGGGNVNGCIGLGCGVIFKIAPDGTESVVYAFAGGKEDGYLPTGVIADKRGNLYGTTYGGGRGARGYGLGTVFKISRNGTKSTLHKFSRKNGDGTEPVGGLVADSSGNMFGATASGGAFEHGTIFKLSPDHTVTVIYSFAGGTDGATPDAGLILDKTGSLYGTTIAGGGSGCNGDGCGTVFRLASDGTETVLHSFAGGTDGYYPTAALIKDKSGNLFGTTTYGGGDGCQGLGCGTVFKLAADNTETVLHAFADSNNDGSWPSAALTDDGNGNLYGTTKEGGAYTDCGPDSCGTVFMLKK